MQKNRTLGIVRRSQIIGRKKCGFDNLKLTHLEGKRQPKIDPPGADLW